LSSVSAELLRFAKGVPVALRLFDTPSRTDTTIYLDCETPQVDAQTATAAEKFLIIMLNIFRFSAIKSCSRGLVAAQYQYPLATAFSRNFASAGLDPSDAEKRVLKVLSCFSKIDQNKLTKDAHFIKDLGLNSLDAVEIVMVLEEEFNVEIPDEHAEKILSAKDAINYLSSHPHAA